MKDGYTRPTPKAAQRAVTGECSASKQAVQAPVLSWTKYFLKDVEVAYVFAKLRWEVLRVVED